MEIVIRRVEEIEADAKTTTSCGHLQDTQSVDDKVLDFVLETAQYMHQDAYDAFN